MPYKTQLPEKMFGLTICVSAAALFSFWALSYVNSLTSWVDSMLATESWWVNMAQSLRALGL